MARPTKSEVIEIPQPQFGEVTFGVIGTMPLLCESMSFKAKSELLLPAGRKTQSERKQTLKHDPINEYRASVLRYKGKADAAIAFPAAGFKRAMASAALDVPGANKTQMGRLTWVEGEYLPVWGDPKLHMSIVRSADINHTPDVRTRCILDPWCAEVTVRFLMPALTQTTIFNLMSIAGQTIGVGGWRPEKGSGTYGQFILTTNLSDLKPIKEFGRAHQERMLAEPETYDEESTELLAWYLGEVTRRGRAGQDTLVVDEGEEESNG